MDYLLNSLESNCFFRVSKIGHDILFTMIFSPQLADVISGHGHHVFRMGPPLAGPPVPGHAGLRELRVRGGRAFFLLDALGF